MPATSPKIEGNVAARKLADEVLDYALSEAKRLTDQYDAETGARFFDMVRDAFNEIRPVEPIRSKQDLARHQSQPSAGYVWVVPDEPALVVGETDAAVRIRIDGDEIWLPKSQLGAELIVGNEYREFELKEWLAKERGLDYEE